MSLPEAFLQDDGRFEKKGRVKMGTLKYPSDIDLMDGNPANRGKAKGW